MIDKIVKSLRENLEEWQSEWEYHPVVAWARMPPWLMKLRHLATGIAIHDPHIEHKCIKITIIDGEQECEVPYHRGELEKITEVFKEIQDILREQKSAHAREHDNECRLKLAELVKKL